MFVTKIQRFSTHDGPGIRTVVFLSGCSMRCRWCHNPETHSETPVLLYAPVLCIGCGKCISACRYEAHFENESGEHRINRNKCISCMDCVKVCPSGALSASAADMSIEEIMRPVIRDMPFYGSEGGITLSGGEPLMSGENALAVLTAAKKAGINTAVETSGYFSKKQIPSLAEVTDTFLWDFKDGCSERHKSNTGVSNFPILENLFELDKYPVSIILRCIIIEGVNTDTANIEAITNTFHSLTHCAEVELLPYHPYGGSKYEQLGLTDDTSDEFIPSAETIARIRENLILNGVPVKHI